MNRTHCISFIFLFICLYAGATEYHVSPAGSDAASGSAICIDKDYTGAQRHQVTFAGPFDCGTVSRIVWN